MHTKKIQHFAEAAFWPAALLRRASVLAEGQNLGAGGIHFRRACEVLTVSIKITTPYGVVIFMARGDNPNPLRSFAIFLEKHPNGLLAGGAFAPYKRFATGKTLAQGEFTSPEHFNHRRVERPTGAKPKRKCDLSKQVAFSFEPGLQSGYFSVVTIFPLSGGRSPPYESFTGNTILERKYLAHCKYAKVPIYKISRISFGI